MTFLRAFLRQTSGTAAVEMALIVPLLLILLFGGIEAGHFVWTQHKLVEAVRDGARYAGRLPLNQLCNGTTQIASTQTLANIRLMTRTGQLANASAAPRVPGWTDQQVTVNLRCGQYVQTGLYAEYAATYPGAGGPVPIVSATNVLYPSMFNAMGIVAPAARLNASSTSPGIGL